MEIKQILKELNRNRARILGEPPHLVEKQIDKVLGLNSNIDLRILGGFNSKIAYCTNRDTHESCVISIGNLLIDTNFYHLFNADIELIDPYFGMIKYDSQTTHILNNQIRIALVSLAKPDVYTYPRFALGISDIAHELRNQFQSNVHLFDLQLAGAEEFLETANNNTFDIVGISMTFGLYDVMEDLVEKLQLNSPKTIIVIGGSLAAIDYKEILNRFPKVIVSTGEGESAMPRIIEYLRGDLKLSDIPDIAYSDNLGRICHTYHEQKMGEQSYPDLDLLIDTLKKNGVFQIETSRGCYNECSFCPRHHKGKWRSIIGDMDALDFFLKVYSELLIANEFDPRTQTIYIVDEEFIGGDSEANRSRIVCICSLFYKYNLKFEVSFRMNAVFSLKSLQFTGEVKLQHVSNLNKLGLKRVLVGVESGVDSILKRFNKNVTSAENTQGIRLLTALGIPSRFTYITFDPLMSLEELVETYQYQGRRDLIIDSSKISDVAQLLNTTISDTQWGSISSGIPFYHYIPYMLVSLECIKGSLYYEKLEASGRLREEMIVSLGKRNAVFSDWRIALISRNSQRWIDHNFSLDYTLKSLSKVYSLEKSEKIQSIRCIIKDNAYRLLGKFIYLCNPVKSLINKQPREEISFIENIINCNPILDAEILNGVLREVLKYQKNFLIAELDKSLSDLMQLLNYDDARSLGEQYEQWKNKQGWQYIHEPEKEALC